MEVYKLVMKAVVSLKSGITGQAEDLAEQVNALRAKHDQPTAPVHFVGTNVAFVEISEKSE